MGALLANEPRVGVSQRVVERPSPSTSQTGLRRNAMQTGRFHIAIRFTVTISVVIRGRRGRRRHESLAVQISTSGRNAEQNPNRETIN